MNLIGTISKMPFLNRETNTLSGLVHTKKDRLVGWEEIKKWRTATHTAAVCKFRGVTSKNLLSVALISQVLLSHVCPKCPCCLMFDLI